MIYIQRQNIEQFLALPFVDVCHLKPGAAVADLCFPIPSLFVSWTEMPWPCHSLKCNNISVIFKRVTSSRSVLGPDYMKLLQSL